MRIVQPFLVGGFMMKVKISVSKLEIAVVPKKVSLPKLNVRPVSVGDGTW
jgi:hypothetical protein